MENKRGGVLTKKTVRDVDWPAKTRVIVRVDFNVPITPLGEIRDDFRISQTIPTLKYLLDKGCSLVLISHLGRPGGRVDPGLSLAPVVYRLRELLPDHVVRFCADWVGDEAKAASRRLRPCQLLLLENIRFCPEEEANEPEFAKALSRWGRVLVNDCFGAAQRSTASTVGLAEHLPAVAGLLLAAEIDSLDKVSGQPQRPLGVIFGGAKISDKLKLVEAFLDRADFIAPVGLLAVQFLAAKGWAVGGSQTDQKSVDQAKKILDRLAKEPGPELFLPMDYLLGSTADSGFVRPVSLAGRTLGGLVDDNSAIDNSEFIADIGPAAAAYIIGRCRAMAKVIWNGTAGITETDDPGQTEPPFSHGSRLIARGLAEPGPPLTIIGGGDTLGYLDRCLPALKKQFDLLSTGGGASLTYLSGQKLPAVEALWPAAKNLPLKPESGEAEL